MFSKLDIENLLDEMLSIELRKAEKFDNIVQELSHPDYIKEFEKFREEELYHASLVRKLKYLIVHGLKE